MKNSHIEWTDHTFNPWIGCTKVSPGCAHCYAEARDKRHLIEKVDHWGKGAPRLRTSAANWKGPVQWDRESKKGFDGYSKLPANFITTPQRRPRVFCASQADWLDEEVPIEWLADLLKLIHDTPNLDWLLLTKRPENFERRVIEAGGMPRSDTPDEPPHNIWVGTTVEDQQRADERIPALLKIPARVRFLSCEPLLGPVEICPCMDGVPAKQLTLAHAAICHRVGIHWVIGGGESGAGARPMHPEWARSLRDQCQAASVPFFFKQWGDWVPASIVHELPDHEATRICTLALDGTQANETTMPYSKRDGAKMVCRVGKKIAGRSLDGCTWDEVPK